MGHFCWLACIFGIEGDEVLDSKRSTIHLVPKKQECNCVFLRRKGDLSHLILQIEAKKKAKCTERIQRPASKDKQTFDGENT